LLVALARLKLTSNRLSLQVLSEPAQYLVFSSFLAFEVLVMMETTSTTTSASPEQGEEPSNNKSALQDNLERKGKNAYYFAHAHKASGPQWDGKPEPKLLSKQESTVGHRVSQNSTFDYSKSNITTYAFLDDGAKVKLYIDMENVGEKCSAEDVVLDFTERTLSLQVHNYKQDEPQILRFGKLTADISTATYRMKKDRLIVTLTKVDKDTEWHTINDKGAPDHEVV